MKIRMKEKIIITTMFKTPPHCQNMFNTSQVFGSQMGHLPQTQYPMPFFFSKPLCHYRLETCALPFFCSCNTRSMEYIYTLYRMVKKLTLTQGEGHDKM
jgi:hypothetical protein